MEYEVVVIGAGIGGLTTAAVLAKRGVNVCLVERQSYAGGCAAVVEHAGYQFEPTHGLYCGWEPDGVFDRLFTELTAPAPRPQMVSTPYLVRLPDGLDVPRITNREDFEASLPAAFPECAEAATKFYRDLTSSTSIETKAGTLEHLRSCSPRFRDFIDIQLKALAQCSSVGCSPQLAAGALDPQRSFWEIDGGAQSLIDSLVASFKHSGGKLRLNFPVLRLAYGPDGTPVGVDLLNGERVFATRAIVSNLTIWDTYGKLVGPGRTPRQISPLLKAMSAPGSYQMFLTMAEPTASAMPAKRILLQTPQPDEDSSEAETQLFFYLSSSKEGNSSGADCTAVVSTYTDAQDWFSFHEDLAAFEDRDRTMLESTWARLHSAMPELGAAVELIETATPQTFYETTRRRFGMIGRPTTASATYSMAESPFPNLWLVGDTVAGTFGLDGIVESAWAAARRLTR
jgi:phytoene dehydrogenase-like protein